MDKLTEQKKKELLRIYPILLGILSVLGIVNLFAISEDSLKAAAIVDIFLFILTPVIFILGYIDLKNYTSFSKKIEIPYIVIGVISMWISLVHFCVQNYNTAVADYYGENIYNVWVSMLASLYVAIGIILLILTIINLHNRKKQALYFYVVAITSIVTNIFLTSFNFDTSISLIWAPLSLANISFPLVVDTGLTILTLRIIGDLGIFLFHGFRERKLKIKNPDNTYSKPIMIATLTGAISIILTIIILPILSSVASINTDKYTQYAIAYMVVEIVFSVITFGVGVACMFLAQQNKKYCEIYKRMGFAMILYALTYILMDYIPVATMFNASTDLQALMIADIYQGIIKTLSLIIFTAYIFFNKRLNATLTVLDKEYETSHSTENYSI